MGPIGLPELVVILFIVLLIFGANRLPDVFAGIGKGMRNFKNEVRPDSDKKKE
jgi:sec-independent protein translocase protein TatA